MKVILKYKGKSGKTGKGNYHTYQIVPDEDTDPKDFAALRGIPIAGTVYFSVKDYDPNDMGKIITINFPIDEDDEDEKPKTRKKKKKKKKVKTCEKCKHLGKKKCPSNKFYKNGSGWDTEDPDEVCDDFKWS